MELALMRYKGVTMWCNPVSIEMTSRRLTADYLVHDYGEIHSDAGNSSTIIKGVLELRGENCLDMYADLRKLQKSPGAGVLYVPGYKPVYALFTKLKASADVTPERIVCSFEFTEENSETHSSKSKRIHIVTEGETLYDVAYEHNLKVDDLVKLNPQIRRPDELNQGEEIRIC